MHFARFSPKVLKCVVPLCLPAGQLCKCHDAALHLDVPWKDCAVVERLPFSPCYLWVRWCSGFWLRHNIYQQLDQKCYFHSDPNIVSTLFMIWCTPRMSYKRNYYTFQWTWQATLTPCSLVICQNQTPILTQFQSVFAIWGFPEMVVPLNHPF